MAIAIETHADSGEQIAKHIRDQFGEATSTDREDAEDLFSEAICDLIAHLDINEGFSVERIERTLEVALRKFKNSTITDPFTNVAPAEIAQEKREGAEA